MRQRTRRHVFWGSVVIAVLAAAAPPASAAVTPKLTLDQSAGTATGSNANLGLGLTFAPSGGDSPNKLTLVLPPGLLADASLDGGACLVTTDLSDGACQVGGGTVTADAFGTVPITTPVTFDLVPPPAPGDLAGLAVNSAGTQIGATAEIRVRPSGDPAGVGVTIAFALPNSLYGVPISIAEINSTFDGLRYPTTCPSQPQNLAVAVTSYDDPTPRTVAAPLSVTNCSALPFAPAFGVTAIRDRGDPGVAVTTSVSESPDETSARSVSLGFPIAVVEPDFAATQLVCPNPASGTCKPVGSATATSPLYPKPLTGQAYLTGSLSRGLALTLAFPPPFPLTLTGAISLSSNATTFTGLPDIPLTDLAVSLSSGSSALFYAPCRSSAGTAVATLTDQNGDRTVNAPARFTVAGCPSHRSPAVTVTHATASGLARGRASVRFRVSVAGGGAKLRALTIELPRGLSFVRHRLAHVTLAGAHLRTATLSRGRLVITLRRAVAALSVTIGTGSLEESRALQAKARHRKQTMLLTVSAATTNHQRTTIRADVTDHGA
jgi:hypothetical protein